MLQTAVVPGSGSCVAYGDDGSEDRVSGSLKKHHYCFMQVDFLLFDMEGGVCRTGLFLELTVCSIVFFSLHQAMLFSSPVHRIHS